MFTKFANISHLPQVTENNTPRLMDGFRDYLSYDELWSKSLKRRNLRKKCSDVMAKNPVCRLPGDMVTKAAEWMKSKDVGSDGMNPSMDQTKDKSNTRPGRLPVKTSTGIEDGKDVKFGQDAE
jgi:hypothetical protein